MRRRKFIGLLGCATAWPLAARGQQTSKVCRIGFLSYLGCGASLNPPGAFRQALREVGYVEGTNLVLECREALGRADRFPALAAELARLNVNILVAQSTPATLAAMQATRTIPIVMVAVGDPVASGLVANLARPGGNVTGPSLWPAVEVVPKVLELLKEVVPSVSRLAILQDPTNSAQVLTNDAVDDAVRRLGLRSQRIGVRAAADLDNAFAEALNQRAQALFVYPLPVAIADIRRIADFALEHRLLAVTHWEGFAEQGFLLFYGTRLTDQYSRAAAYIAKILKGTAPADLPIEQPTKFELVINLKTAKALGINIPPTLLARADEVIE